MTIVENSTFGGGDFPFIGLLEKKTKTSWYGEMVYDLTDSVAV